MKVLHGGISPRAAELPAFKIFESDAGRLQVNKGGDTPTGRLARSVEVHGKAPVPNADTRDAVEGEQARREAALDG